MQLIMSVYTCRYHIYVYVNRNTSLICHQTIELTLAHHLPTLMNRENWELSDSTEALNRMVWKKKREISSGKEKKEKTYLVIST